MYNTPTAFVDDISSVNKLKNLDYKLIKIYSMNIDVYCYIKKLNVHKFELIDILNIKSDYLNRRVIAKLRKNESHILNKIKNKTEETEYENFKNILHVLASSAYSLFFEIRNYSTYLIYYNNKWINEKDSNVVFKILFKKNIIEIRSLLNLKINSKQKFSSLIKFLNYFILNSNKHKKSILISTKSYNFDKIINSLIKYDNKIILYTLKSSHKYSVLSLILSYTKYFLGIEKNQVDFIIPRNYRISKFFTKKIIPNDLDNVLSIVKNDIFNFIDDAMNYISSIDKNSFNLLQNIKPKLFLTHHIKWFENLTISNNLNKLNVPVYLISHGSTPLNNQLTGSYQLKKNAEGLAYSKFANFSVANSPLSEEAIKKYMPELNILRLRIWEQNIKKDLKSKNKIILHAGTAKPLGIRNWIYETPNEYIKNLILLSKAVLDIGNIKLIIRARASKGCSIDSIRNLIPKNSNIIIKHGGDFNDDLKKADILVSYSSTTIEQAIYSNVLVALLSPNDRFYHIEKSYNISKKNLVNQVYRLRQNYIKNDLIDLLNFHDNEKYSKNNDINLSWTSSNSHNIDSFVENLLL